ncbi:hypothetical protein KIPB_013666, partial [Kipferlia bialata]|eukprot:g13666.t1
MFRDLSFQVERLRAIKAGWDEDWERDREAGGERGTDTDVETGPNLELPSCGNAYLRSIIGVLSGDLAVDALDPPGEGVVFVSCGTDDE